jgi:hypothetical protein
MKTWMTLKTAILVACSISSASCFAGIVSVNPVVISGEAKVKDFEGGAATTSNAANMGVYHVSSFDPSVGVLTGVKVNVASSRTQSIQVSSTSVAGANTTVSSKGTGTSTAKIMAPGINHQFASVSTDGECTGKRNASCSGSIRKTDTDTAFSGSSTALNAYAEPGTVRFDLSLPSLQASQNSNVFLGNESTQYILSWKGELSVIYEYLQHALPSFNNQVETSVLTLDFGKLKQYSANPYLGFNIFNLGGNDRISLDLDSVDGSGDTDKLTTNLASFYDMPASGQHDFMARFDPVELGVFNAQYILHMSDANFGASNTWRTSDLILNLTGEVVPVPEPVSITLFGIGLAGLIASRKKATGLAVR